MSLAGSGWCDIDFEADGKRVDHLFIPHSVDRSAYGNVGIPIVVIKNGDGPTVLLTGGTHGDEFEGQIVATRVARAVEPSDIHGQLIVIPCLNFPAATNGARVSPVDGGNLNRAFPGDPRGGVTQQIAHYLHTVLMPMADVMIDVHSGGASLEYLPTAFTNLSGKSELDRAAVEAMRVFGAPLSMLFQDDSEARRAVSSAHLNDCVYLASEMGGAGTVGVDALAIAHAGTARLLQHFGLLRSIDALEPIRDAERTRFVQVPSRAYQVRAAAVGIFEPVFRLGQQVKVGQLAGLTYSQYEPTREPSASYFQADGFVICRRHPGLVQPGDCLAHVAVEFDVSTYEGASKHAG
jgi:predicted deacylase